MYIKTRMLALVVMAAVFVSALSGCSTGNKKEKESKTFIDVTEDGLVAHFDAKDKEITGGSGITVKEGQDIVVDNQLTKGQVHITASPGGDDINTVPSEEEVTASIDQVCNEEGGMTEYHNVVPGSYMVTFSAEKPSSGDIVVTVKEAEAKDGGSIEGHAGEAATAVAAADIDDTASYIYTGADAVTDVAMGTCIEGKQTRLCTIKVPTNYIIASLYMDENGERHTMPETDGKIVSDVIANGGLAGHSEVPDTIVLGAQGNIDNSFTFAITDSETISVESEEEFAPGGIEAETADGQKAYIYETSGQFDIVMVYELNKDWTLMVGNTGGLKDSFSLEEIGRGLYSIVSVTE